MDHIISGWENQMSLMIDKADQSIELQLKIAQRNIGDALIVIDPELQGLHPVVKEMIEGFYVGCAGSPLGPDISDNRVGSQIAGT